MQILLKGEHLRSSLCIIEASSVMQSCHQSASQMLPVVLVMKVHGMNVLNVLKSGSHCKLHVESRWCAAECKLSELGKL